MIIHLVGFPQSSQAAEVRSKEHRHFQEEQSHLQMSTGLLSMATTFIVSGRSVSTKAKKFNFSSLTSMWRPALIVLPTTSRFPNNSPVTQPNGSAARSNRTLGLQRAMWCCYHLWRMEQFNRAVSMYLGEQQLIKVSFENILLQHWGEDRRM